MVLVNIIAVMALLFSLLGGLKEGAVKHAFSLAALLIAIPVAGASYHITASVLSFLPGENWKNFVGFFITMGVIIIILHIFFFLPGRIIQKVWRKGVFFRLIGGALNLLETAIGIAVFNLVIGRYPVFNWLAEAVTGSTVVIWLSTNLSFVNAMMPLPEIY